MKDFSQMPKITQEQYEVIYEKSRVDESVVLGALARVPPSWTMIQRFPSGAAFKRGNIQVVFTVQRYDDGRTWVHVSACGRRGESPWFLPDWEDMKRVKNDFVGDAWAYQVFPPASQYVNQHAYVLHLFALLDGAPALPDFTWGMGSI